MTGPARVARVVARVVVRVASRRGLARDERGSIAPALPIIAMALLLLGGLGIDGSRQLNARGQATAFAEEAARAGAEAVNINSPDLRLVKRSDPGTEDLQTPEERVRKYCDDILRLEQVKTCTPEGIRPVSDDDPRELVVVTHVSMEVKTSLLSMIGLQTLTASATAKARPFEGVSGIWDANNGPTGPSGSAPSDGSTPDGSPSGGPSDAPSGTPSGGPTP